MINPTERNYRLDHPTKVAEIYTNDKTFTNEYVKMGWVLNQQSDVSYASAIEGEDNVIVCPVGEGKPTIFRLDSFPSVLVIWVSPDITKIDSLSKDIYFGPAGHINHIPNGGDTWGSIDSLETIEKLIAEVGSPREDSEETPPVIPSDKKEKSRPSFVNPFINIHKSELPEFRKVQKRLDDLLAVWETCEHKSLFIIPGKIGDWAHANLTFRLGTREKNNKPRLHTSNDDREEVLVNMFRFTTLLSERRQTANITFERIDGQPVLTIKTGAPKPHDVYRPIEVTDFNKVIKQLYPDAVYGRLLKGEC